MKKVVYISDVESENREKYGSNSRKKVKVTYIEDGEISYDIDYLDETKTEKDLNDYANRLKQKKWDIHLASDVVKKRIIYNLIMTALCLGGVFAILGISNLLIAVGAPVWLIAFTSTIAIITSWIGPLAYVNNRKFYYNKKEIELLDEINSELNKCNDLSGEIYKLKQMGKFDKDEYERLHIDYQDTINKNKERNYQMQREKSKLRKESNERVMSGVRDIVGDDQNNRIDDYFVSTNKKKKILDDKKNIVKAVKKEIIDFVKEEQDYANRKNSRNNEDNYFIRSESRNGRRKS